LSVIVSTIKKLTEQKSKVNKKIIHRHILKLKILSIWKRLNQVKFKIQERLNKFLK